MKECLAFVSIALLAGLVVVIPKAQGRDTEPVWAYAPNPNQTAGGGRGAAGGPARGAATSPSPGAAAGTPAAGGAGRGAGGRGGDTTPVTLPGSKVTLPRNQVSNMYGPVDWFPEDHPPMPEVVAHGRAPETQGGPAVGVCAFCHLPNGYGRPENAPIAGLSKEYILQQLLDFKSGARKNADTRKPNNMGMITPFMTEKEMQDAAAYFASVPAASTLPIGKWIRVVETDTVKTTRIQGQMFHLVEDGKTEPIGTRIVEAPENEEHEALRSPRAGFVAYVPVGSVMRGWAIVTTGGNGKTFACSICHGQGLKGMGPVPPLAGRSPSYLARQAWDLQQGTRAGPWSPLMKSVVANFTAQDFVDVFAYIASLPQ